MRLPDLKESELNDEQRRVYQAIAGGPRGGVRGPFGILMRTPALADQIQQLGEYCRFKSSLSPRISEFAICIVARQWTSQIEWNGHSKLAIKGGLDERILADLAQGRRPANMKPDEAAAYQLCTELHTTYEVSDATYAEAVKQFGEAGVLDLCGVSGYYVLVAMVLKTAQKPLPAGTPDPLPVLKK
jgi:4-carboxymuconolactone decarboxylase